ncbi:MAG: hypothetical protein R3A44_43065 [Caldilineaceae bacterium]
MDAQIGELQQRLQTAHTRFVQVAEQLDPVRHIQPGVCGAWSPKDVAAHLVGWDASLKQLIVDIENFEPPYDVHAFNQRSVEARADRTWAVVMAELTTNFDELSEALAIVAPEMKIYARVTGWLAGRIADYELHTEQLESWLAQ